MIRVADYIAQYISNLGVDHIFMVSGGGMMFLSDALALHPMLTPVCTHHEQAAAMATVGYAKYKGSFGVCYLTTGCGGTNAITGLLNAWQDSTPCIFVSGQSKLKETIRKSGLPLRQFGVQEADIVTIVSSITKYSVMIEEPQTIAYHLDFAVHLASSGRPGPVWIDVPLDVQASLIDPDSLQRFVPEDTNDPCLPGLSNSNFTDFLKLLDSSSRPVILAGQGVRLSKSLELFRTFVDQSGIPVVVSKLGVDLLPYDSQSYVGQIGNKGDRAGNLAVQNADLVIVLGCRLAVSTTGHEYSQFAREAKIVVVDVDAVEHKKGTVRIDKFIHCDLGAFLSSALNIGNMADDDPFLVWREKCQTWKIRYPVCLPEYGSDQKGVNLYYFVNTLFELMPEDGVVIWDAGSALYVVNQAARIKGEIRLVGSGGQAEMGYTLPASIGVSFARGAQPVIGITGDGSFQMNIQELQTVKHHGLPIKLFVWNNNGYLSIRSTQKRFFEGRLIGSDGRSGVSFPDIYKITSAYGLEYRLLKQSKSLRKDLKDVLSLPGPVICEVICNPDQEIIPAVSAVRNADGTMTSKPLEDMYPFLDRSEFLKEMVVKPVE